MGKHRTFWHVTPACNIDSILDRGIDPQCARSERKLMWVVEWRGLPFALAHVSARHSVSVDKLYAVRCEIRVDALKHHRLWIWYSPRRCKRGLKALRGDVALNRWEAQRQTMRSWSGRRVRSEKSK